MTRTTAIVLTMGVALRAATASTTLPESEPGTDTPQFDRQVVASGLQSPDGLAIHPTSGELYVSEETGGRISVVRNGRVEPVIGPRITVAADLPAWMVTTERPGSHWTSGTLASPEGITFGPDGTLYVVEDTARGRVLAFEPSAAGRYTTARVMPIPDLGEPYAWESICMDHDGRLFLAGSSHEAGTGWSSSCVLSRDTTQGWWMVDFGPFASFSAVALAGAEDVLVAGDEAVGGLTWWDLKRRQEIQTLSQSLGAIEGLAVLSDGSLVVAQETTVNEAGTGTAGGRLLRVDPASGAHSVIAEGLGTLESVVCDLKSGKIYAAEDSSGRILCFTPRQPLPPRQELLQVARRSGEARRGLPPRQTPDFLKHFMRQVGVELVEQSERADRAPDGGSAPASGIPPLTLEELGQHIPLVAGRVEVEALADVEDPITEVSFINLFPNQIAQSEKRAIPSICLFAAKHRSGKVDRSQILGGYQARKVSPDGAAEIVSPEALMMLPLTTCSAVESDNGVTVAMTFLGLDRLEDCFLTLNYGRRNDAYFAVSDDKLKVARATFAERHADGREVVNFAMTGIRPRRVEDATWLPLRAQAGWSLLSPSMETWVSRWALAQMPDLVAKMRRFNREALDALLAADEEAARGGIVARPEKAGDSRTVPESADIEKKDDNRASNQPKAWHPPLAYFDFPPAEREQDQLLTNLILSRIVQAWNNGATQ